jgi:hypothetical protein
MYKDETLQVAFHEAVGCTESTCYLKDVDSQEWRFGSYEIV